VAGCQNRHAQQAGHRKADGRIKLRMSRAESGWVDRPASVRLCSL